MVLGKGPSTLGAWLSYLFDFLLTTPRGFETTREGWAAAIAASTREEFFETARVADPRTYITMYEKLKYYTNSHFKPPVAPFVNKFTDFVRIPQDMRDWTETELIKVCDLFLLFSLC